MQQMKLKIKKEKQKQHIWGGVWANSRKCFGLNRRNLAQLWQESKP